MKYFEIIDSMLNEPTFGFNNIVAGNQELKNKILTEIKKAKCSIATAKTFIGFVEIKLEEQMPVEMSETMLETAILIGNGCGLDPTRYSEVISDEDLKDLKIISNFQRT